MITEQDLREAIAECQGERNPNANTAIKLAAFLTIQREMFGSSEQGYSFAAEPPEPIFRNSDEETVGDYGDSDFLQAIHGQDPAEAWAVVDELMDTLKMMNGRLYESVMRKLR